MQKSLSSYKLDFMAEKDRYKKKSMLTIRLLPEDYEDFSTVANLRGLSMSALISGYIRQVVREEKSREPMAFKTQTIPVLKEKAK